MQITNTQHGYGWVAIGLHWLSAVMIVGMFALGWWMVELTYYDAWYTRAPAIHKSVGLLFAVVLVFRLAWRLGSKLPAPVSHRRWEQVAAKISHIGFYCLIAAIIGTGYLISTAEGDPVSVFGWFDVPAIGPFIEDQADLAGDVHWYLAVSVIVLAVLHALAAIKHHTVDADNTLRRIFRPEKRVDQ